VIAFSARGIGTVCPRQVDLHGCPVAEPATDADRTAGLAHDPEPCDLIVMDQLMPGLLGTETVRLARQTRPELKVLFVTGYTGKFELEGSSDPLIMKPFTSATLGEAIWNALRQTRRSESGNVMPLRRRGKP
jgi:two-component system cell cycle sensor histidine kinase/response regulator CckA